MIRNNDSDSTKALIKDLFLKIRSIKYAYFICIVLFVTVAVGYNKYSTKIYEVSASVGPVQNDASLTLRSNDLFRGIESFQTNMNIENEIENLNSFNLVSSAISSLNLEISYFVEKDKLFRERNELYKNSPITVNIDKSHVQPIATKFYFKILTDTTFRITVSEDDVILYNYLDNSIVSEGNILKINIIGRFNETIDNKNFKFSISLNKEHQPAISDPENFYYFKLHHKDYQAKQYLESFKFKPVSPLASIIEIRFRGDNIRRIIDFLNVYLESYLEDDLAKKNKVARNTINFIDSQISEISDSLVLSESKLRNVSVIEFSWAPCRGTSTSTRDMSAMCRSRNKRVSQTAEWYARATSLKHLYLLLRFMIAWRNEASRTHGKATVT